MKDSLIPSSITGKGSSFPPGGSVLDHAFGASDPYTLGVEEEYMLLDGQTFDLVQHIDEELDMLVVLVVLAGSAGQRDEEAEDGDGSNAQQPAEVVARHVQGILLREAGGAGRGRFRLDVSRPLTLTLAAADT